MNVLSEEIRNEELWELLCADLVITAKNEDDLKKRIGEWQESLEREGLKVNVYKTEVLVSSPRKRYHNDNWGPNKRFGGGGRGGGGQFDGGWGGGGWGGGWGGNNWNSWNDQYNNYGGYDKYEEEEADEDDTSANEAWIAEETKLLEEEFGPGIISIMYDDDGGMMYVCDICQSQLNGRKSLDVHINGMKHLKKKNIWEKKRRLENFKEAEGEPDQKKSDTNNSTGGKDTNQGGIPSLYTQPPPSVTGMHPVSFPPPLTVPPNQWNTPPPPPPAAAEQQQQQQPKFPKLKTSLKQIYQGVQLEPCYRS
ncbi:uncharacterized protein LOC135225073 [Macrobrachium nipponense]|uniref:uncharacterized protein LOC135225073 n=1 Tax=Macrobrachium nipponense TaxID=159736 RepID=UPI0030C80627